MHRYWPLARLLRRRRIPRPAHLRRAHLPGGDVNSNNTALDRIAAPAVPTPGFLGQATAIEQSRAVAEVQAAVIVAQQRPRNVNAAVNEMRAACQQPGLAERAFFRYSRGGGQVSGATIHLARELARCWGNIQYGIAELRRDD